MSANDDLRLAWQAHRDGRIAMRDALLTLAVARGEPEGAPWVMPVRDFLVSSRRDHYFSRFAYLDEALADRRVVAALARLRESFPPARIRSLVLRSEALRGPYTGRRVPVTVLLEDLLDPTRPRRRESIRLEPSSGPDQIAAIAEATTPAPDEPILRFYLQVLLGVATLCAVVLDDRLDEQRAA